MSGPLLIGLAEYNNGTFCISCNILLLSLTVTVSREACLRIQQPFPVGINGQKEHRFMRESPYFLFWENLAPYEAT